MNASRLLLESVLASESNCPEASVSGLLVKCRLTMAAMWNWHIWTGIGCKAPNSPPHAVTDDSPNMKAMPFQPIHAFDIVIHMFMPPDELVPKHLVAVRILQNDNAKPSASVRCVHLNNTILVL
ncbi:hypothetical protein E5358_14730 [Palleniella muris]|uniref:Uncharacterized protein n=1 Tax=Palleniella muris TaxID=3038145 RepID=A0AC61QLI3_9BACT|nr:hypothetical protein [Palleniella muris]TGX79598.1 hypothetical protein E5358_14730 [Palleniella muris]